MSEISTLQYLTSEYAVYKVYCGYENNSYADAIKFVKRRMHKVNEYLPFCIIEEISVGFDYSMVYILQNNIETLREEKPHLFI